MLFFTSYHLSSTVKVQLVQNQKICVYWMHIVPFLAFACVNRDAAGDMPYSILPQLDVIVNYTNMPNSTISSRFLSNFTYTAFFQAHLAHPSELFTKSSFQNRKRSYLKAFAS
jgi:hypothetical protein